MPIQGKIKQELTIQNVLNKTSELEIFQHFIPDKQWKLNEIMHSPLRKDTNSSFLIGNKYGNIIFKDFAVHEHKGDVFKFVKILYNLPNLDAVLRLIDAEMGLGIGNSVEVRSKPISEINYKQEVNKRTTLVQVITKPFSALELQYWKEYGITKEELQADNVYSIKKAYLNKKLLSLDELRFAYYYDGLFKIYQPLSDKKRKWLSNVPLTYIDGKENIKNCKTALITKSKKDMLILRKIYNCVCSTQNESMACFSKENVDFIKSNSEKQYILYDSDESGKRASLEITKKYNMGYCNVPNKYLNEGIKDFASLVKHYSIKVVEDYLKEKQLI